jgi:hypothetical protein
MRHDLEHDLNLVQIAIRVIFSCAITLMVGHFRYSLACGCL